MPHPSSTSAEHDLAYMADGLHADAAEMVQRGFATATDVDTAMRLGAGHPRSPLTDEPVEVPAPSAETSPYDGPIGVVGTGTMATGIAEAIAAAGQRVIAVGRSEQALEASRLAMTAGLDRRVARGKLDQATATETSGRVTFSADRVDLAACPLVVEAVVEDLGVKRDLMSELHAALPARTVLATNTSSFRVSEVVGHLSGRDVAAVHFFNPAPAMRLVEIVVPGATDDCSLGDTLSRWVRSIHKTPVGCGDERGFIVNRLLIPFLNDAAREVEDGAEPEDVDAWPCEHLGHPMGPLRLIDLIGVDVTVAALASMHETTQLARLAPADVLVQLIERGRLGRKSGAGFYNYDGDR